MIGPGSALQRYASDWRVFAFLVRASLLQGGHPVVSQGTLDHGITLTDPLRRIKETGDYGRLLLLGDDQVGVANEIRAMHHDIHGQLPSGKRYHAWNPEAWAFVHLTICEAILHGIDLFYRVSPDDLEEVYAGLRVNGRLMGVQDELMPATVPGLQAWLADAADQTVTQTPLVDAFQELYRRPVQVPQLRLPTPVWTALQPAAGLVLTHAVGVVSGMLPDQVRSHYAPHHNWMHAFEYRLLVASLRAASILPRRWRTVPAVHVTAAG